MIYRRSLLRNLWCGYFTLVFTKIPSECALLRIVVKCGRNMKKFSKLMMTED